MIGAAVALFGVFLSNRTNRKAIDAADERSRNELHESRDHNFRSWQRDTVVQILGQAKGHNMHVAPKTPLSAAGAQIAPAVVRNWIASRFSAAKNVIGALRGTMRQGACVSWMLLVRWVPAGLPHAGTLLVIWAVPARVFGSHV